LIHVECNRGETKVNADRLSRHWYDLRMLARHEYGQRALENRVLFEDVVRHKQVFFNASYANYGACLNNQLKLLPKGDFIQQLQTDYERMLGSGMIYEDAASFDDIISDIRKIENQVNRR